MINFYYDKNCFSYYIFVEYGDLYKSIHIAGYSSVSNAFPNKGSYLPYNISNYIPSRRKLELEDLFTLSKIIPSKLSSNCIEQIRKVTKMFLMEQLNANTKR